MAALDADDEILQDFLVEASEILERLNEQLVELEQRADDKELLNAVFRGFHTIKGGAGFLNLTALVDVCHRAEDVFNKLRNGELSVSAEMMDTMLPVLDVLNAQFESLRAMEEPAPAEAELLERLEAIARGEAPAAGAVDEIEALEVEPSAVITPSIQPPPAGGMAEPELPPPSGAAEVAPTPTPTAGGAGWAMAGGEPDGDITDEEFEALLHALETPGAPAAAEAELAAAIAEPAPPPAASDEITEEEFEALLDQLHGKGQFHGAPSPEVGAADEDGAGGRAEPPPVASDEITEEEFEALLDQLHGKGQFKGALPPIAEQTATPPTETPAPPTAGVDSGEPPAVASDEITEEEFEALLDQLHGKGQFHGMPAGAAAGGTPPPTTPPPPAASAAGAAETPPPSAKQPPAAKRAEPSRPTPASRPAEEERETKKPAAEQSETTVRVDTKRLDDIMNMVGELVLVRNRLATIANLEQADTTQSREQLLKTVANLDVVTGDLQAAVMKTRMQPIKKVFGRFPRVVRDLARSLKKEVHLELQGEETDLDKNLVEALADPLVHLVRNAVDHGIEMPDMRTKAGKSASGTLRLSAEQEGDHILLVVEDDGAGMNPEVLRRKAVEKGMMDADAAARLDDKEAFMLIMAPGFSTKTEISDISGRGVGMDVVKTRIAQLNGSIDIDSVIGKGTRLSIKVPLTLAIMPTLMVKLREQTFALPLVSVSEIFHLDLTRTNVVDGQLVVMVREKALPLFYLTRWLVRSMAYEKLPKTGHVVVVHVGTQLVGFVVDHLIGQEEVVIKPLGSMLQGTPGMAGATITGDGKIALILDVPGLMRAYARRGA